MHQELQILTNDLNDINLPVDLSNLDKIKTSLDTGMHIGWYYKDDLDFWKEDNLDPYEYSQYEGIIIPAPNSSQRVDMDVSECVVVIINYPCEKSSPECDYVTLCRLVDNPELVEIYKINTK